MNFLFTLILLTTTVTCVSCCYPTNVCRGAKQIESHNYSESHKYTCVNGSVWIHRYSDFECSILTEMVLANITTDHGAKDVQCDGCTDYYHGRKYNDYAISTCDFDADFGDALYALGCNQNDGNSEYIECDSFESATFYSYNNTNCNGIPHQTVVYLAGSSGCEVNATVEYSNGTIVEFTVFSESLYCGSIELTTSGPTSTSATATDSSTIATTTSSTIDVSTTSTTASSTISTATDLPTIAANGCYPTNVCRAEKQQTLDTDPYSKSYKYTCDNNGNILIHSYSDLECSILTETVLADVNDVEVQTVQCDGCTDYFHGRKYNDYAISTCDFDADFTEALYALGCTQEDGNQYIECDSESATFYSYNNTNCNGIPLQTVIYRAGSSGCGVSTITVEYNGTIVESPVFTESLYCGSIELTTSGPTSTSATATASSNTISTATDSSTIATTTSSSIEPTTSAILASSNVSVTTIQPMPSNVNTGNCYDNLIIIIFIISFSISVIL